MQVRTFAAGNSKHNVTSSKSLKKDFPTETSILRRNGFVVIVKGFCRTDSKDSTVVAINDMYDENGGLIGTMTVKQDKTSYTEIFTAKASSLTVKFIPDSSKITTDPLTEDLISKYPTLAKYRGKLGYTVVSANESFIKGDESTLSFDAKVQDTTPFSKAISGANSIEFQTVYLMNSGRLVEAIYCRYLIA